MNKKFSTDISIWMLLVSTTANPIQIHVLRLESQEHSVITKPGHIIFLVSTMFATLSSPAEDSSYGLKMLSPDTWLYRSSFVFYRCARVSFAQNIQQILRCTPISLSHMCSIY